jgi:transposase InsO family protein
MYEWTYILDTFNNEIISHHISTKEGDKRPYYQCLEDLKTKIKEQKDPVVLHTDQGSVYSSRAFSEAHKDYNIIRSMSRVATPTDNPIIESINGWIKSELRCDYTKEEKSDLPGFLNKYVEYFNNERPAYALGYLSPIQYKVKNGFP